MRFLSVLLIVVYTSTACGLNILGIFPYHGQSHFFTVVPFLEELIQRGHNLTLATCYSLNKENVVNYREIKLPLPTHTEWTDNLTGSRMEKYKMALLIHEVLRLRCESLIDTEEYKSIFNLTTNFDLILTEHFMSGCHVTAILKKFQVPFVFVQTHVLTPLIGIFTGNSDNPAYIPLISTDFPKKMSFFEKVENTVYWVCSYLFTYSVAAQDQYFLDVVSGTTTTNAFDYMLNVSLVLVNTYFPLSGARPLVPQIVEVGGWHIKNSTALPQHLEKWINESTQGVIYFSLGSMIKGHTFPEEKRQMFMRAFSRFPQRVLWKWETDTMPGKPENVMIEKWMPQFDILSHPNVKAFIGHGGLLGVTEAVHCGVPLIIMPQFGDQFTNAKAVEASGGGVILDYRSLDEESIYNALKTVLDPSFNKKAKELSARFRDRPMPPLETAIYWVEYVARHGGAPHLRTAAVGMPLYQYLLLDVVAFLAAVVLTITYISFIVMRAIFRRIFKTNKVEKVKKN